MCSTGSMWINWIFDGQVHGYKNQRSSSTKCRLTTLQVRHKPPSIKPSTTIQSTMTTINSVDKSSHEAYKPSETALLLLDWYSLFVEKVAGPAAIPALDVAVQLRK